jgi:excisionase family DNA binding protein
MATEIQPLVHRINNACSRLGISRTTLYALIKEEKLRTFQIGGRVVIAESELQRFVAQAMQEAA